ncbi:hypothetical protein WME76_40140 [Sorangium sp. So ce119]|uniref:hypothetical protein n=1 Tax=Sorangium sp. So ce119 TaxID=3133279 RepID=UPI003F60C16D
MDRRKFGIEMIRRLQRDLGGRGLAILLHQWHALFDDQHDERVIAEDLQSLEPIAPGSPCPSMREYNDFAGRPVPDDYVFSLADFEFLLAVRECLAPAAEQLKKTMMILRLMDLVTLRVL